MRVKSSRTGIALVVFTLGFIGLITLALASTTWAAPNAQGTVPTPPPPRIKQPRVVDKITVVGKTMVAGKTTAVVIKIPRNLQPHWRPAAGPPAASARRARNARQKI